MSGPKYAIPQENTPSLWDGFGILLVVEHIPVPGAGTIALINNFVVAAGAAAGEVAAPQNSFFRQLCKGTLEVAVFTSNAELLSQVAVPFNHLARISINGFIGGARRLFSILIVTRQIVDTI